MSTSPLLWLSFLLTWLPQEGYAAPQKNRVIILTDIEADPDDTQSLVRLLLYANQIDLKGIVATTSCWMQEEVSPASIAKVVKAYGKVQSNLLKHEPDYPTADQLLSLIKSGLPQYGMTGVGAGMDSEGSDWIIQELQREDDRPLWVSVWGGVNTLAQALHKIKRTSSQEEAARLVRKLRVYTISDQDDSGIWIRNNFPDLFYIVSPGDDYDSATWTGINGVFLGIDNTTISNSWFKEHVQQGHGPLGAVYPDVSWGVEGDTPAFLSLIPNGLNHSEHPVTASHQDAVVAFRLGEPLNTPGRCAEHGHAFVFAGNAPVGADHAVVAVLTAQHVVDEIRAEGITDVLPARVEIGRDRVVRHHCGSESGSALEFECTVNEGLEVVRQVVAGENGKFAEAVMSIPSRLSGTATGPVFDHGVHAFVAPTAG